MKRIEINYTACKTILIIFFIFINLIGFGQTIIYSDDFESGFEGWSSANWMRDANPALGASDGNYLHPTSFDDYGVLVDVTTTSGTIDLTGYYDLLLQIDISYGTDNALSIEDGFNALYLLDE